MKVLRKIGGWFKKNPSIFFLLYFAIYLPMFFVENTMLTPVWWLDTPLDAMIPSNEFFIIPYCLWYLMMPVSLLVFFFMDRAAYKNLCFLMFTSMTIAMVFYAIVPNGLASDNPSFYFETGRDNIFVDWAILIRGASKHATCFPSIHCAVALSIDFALQRSKRFKKFWWLRILSTMLMVSICAATVFLKQHSVIDMFASLFLVLTLNLISLVWVWYRDKKAFYKVNPQLLKSKLKERA